MVIGIREVYWGESIKLILHLKPVNCWTCHVYDLLNLDQSVRLEGNMVSQLKCREMLISGIDGIIIQNMTTTVVTYAL